MPVNGVSRAYLDTAGGTIQVGNPDFYLDGLPVAMQGNPVQSHGNNEHSSAVIVNGSPNFLINGIPVCTSASQASCGHQATGSSTFTVGTSSRGSESRNPGIAMPPYQPAPSTETSVPNPFWISTWYPPHSIGTATNSLSLIRPELLVSEDFNRYKWVKPFIWLIDPIDSSGYIASGAQGFIDRSNGIGTSDPIYRQRFNSIVSGLNSCPDGMGVLAPWYYWNAYVLYDTVPNLTPYYPSGPSGGTSDRTTNPIYADYNTYPYIKPSRTPAHRIKLDANNNPVGFEFTESTDKWDLIDVSHPDNGKRSSGIFMYNRASDNLRGTTTYGGVEYKWSVGSPYGMTAATQIRNDWSILCAELKRRGARIDQIVFDFEGTSISAFDINSPKTPTGLTLARASIAAVLEDHRANESWLGDVSFNDVFTQKGKYSFPISTLMTPNGQHPQTNPSYLYFDAAMASLRNSTMNYCFWDTLKQHYPDAGLCNYDCMKTKDTDTWYNIYGHPQFQDNTVGDGASPYLYWAWNYDSSNSAWQINPLDTTRLKRNNVNPQGVAFGNNAWNCFLLDMQTIRAIRRADSEVALRPWIRPRDWAGEGSLVVAKLTPDRNPPASGSRFMYEIMRHAALCGAQNFFYWNTTDFTTGNHGTNNQEINDVLQEMNDTVGGYTKSIVIKERVSFLADYVISGAKAEAGNNSGKYVWRITPKPGLTLISETGRPLTVDSDGGAWLVTSSVVIPKYSVQ